ncbi:exodeoxyribonuclease VII large subunit [Tardiphaga sp. vice352]|uniref:exodeoxyribonuclease VII large subunit n=1 Tax=unclassified Tardiphaga TaxID=2631404 RepID=UPI001164DFE1|nr:MULTISPECIES: exodeoxyribonuclease VII large subunit [unclassified Tardiphaga]QDM18336.1 exodeoxyribonuclease VII large subunit [Tardiphaga sp. vice278]QDM23340.1 exodeoxyribonuclease VII large subunit [Tardiphaga sp. vice154]QDM28561.1 exodeoxyribonuclease VII large subunit [Tardiphaga sp. vice304]QDM33660.1 exodeoxyribonuclease VII large subunit [Tardiphaga sp. vice352]
MPRSPAALSNSSEFTVTELSSALKRTVEDAYGHVRVRGEISGFRGAHSSGHCYFALKDEGAKIEAVIWKGVHGKMRFKPQEGLEVIATGKLTTYPGSSKYQIVIESIEPAGVGALMALMEERKRKLSAEGLFDESRKQLLPWLPEVIGVVTSPTGAVIRDILHRLADRFPRRVLVWPVKVQGEGSAEQIAAAIHGFNALPEGGKIPRPDLLIVARGGGSLEDLWSFNEEIVVRAAAESMIPLISAVGHETDITLIDFASDKRAPTPTAAAEMAVPVRAELFVEISAYERRMMLCWQRGQERRRTELRAATRALPSLSELLAIPRQRLDGAGASLPRALKANTSSHHRRFAQASAGLTLRVLRGQIAQATHRFTVSGERLTLASRAALRQRRDRFAGLSIRLQASKVANAQAQRNALARDRERAQRLSERARRALATLVQRQQARVLASGQLLAALSYRSVLARGFALVRDADGAALHAAANIGPGARLSLEFADGRVGVTADMDRAAVAPREVKPAAPKRTTKPVDQGTLF